MKKNIRSNSVILLFFISIPSLVFAQNQYFKYVNPFIGTEDDGRIYPNAVQSYYLINRPFFTESTIYLDTGKDFIKLLLITSKQHFL